MVYEDAALLNRHVTHMTPPHFSAAVYNPFLSKIEVIEPPLSSLLLSASKRLLHPMLCSIS
jgi:hypothetical protein